ncbi:MAG TPA: hypothetical protein VFR17_06350 [Mycobacterium sp.]|nr:hypothetical protein [Mycobacterium sp.]
MTTERKTPPRQSDRRRRPERSARTASRRPADAPPSRAVRRRGGTTPPPGREAKAAKSGPQTKAVARTSGRAVSPKNTQQAKARAKARKAKAPRVVRTPLRERLIRRLASVDLRPRTLAAKVPFVVLVIGSLGVGLGITLWLSTDAAERSYQLGSIREQNRVLLQQKESLERDVRNAESAPALAEAARELGMIPTKDTAHLIKDPAGNWVVVGSPKPAEGAPPAPLNTKLPDEPPGGPPPPAVRPAEVPVRVAPGAAGTGPEAARRAPRGGTVSAPGLPPVSAPGLPPDGLPAQGLPPEGLPPVPGVELAPVAVPPSPEYAPPAQLAPPAPMAVAPPALPAPSAPPAVAQPGQPIPPGPSVDPGATG